MMDVSNIGKVIYSQCNSIVSCYPTMAPQKTAAPYLVYHILRVQPDNIKGAVAPVDIATVLLFIYGSTVSDIANLAILVRNRIDNQYGTIAGVAVDRMQYVTENDGFDNDLKVYYKSIEYEFRIKNDGTTEIMPALKLSANYTYAAAIPAGYALVSVLTYNTFLTTISIGTTVGGTNIMDTVDCQGPHTQTVDKWFSKTVATTIYITSANWADTVEFYFLIEKIN